MNKKNSSAVQKTLVTAQKALESGKAKESLFLMQSLLRTAPNFLEARQLARQAARIVFSQKKEHLPRLLVTKTKALLMILRVQFLIRKKDFLKSLVLLEKILGELPDFVLAHRLMAQVALKTTPPLPELALFAWEEVVVLQPKNISFHLELARVALLSEAHGGPCQAPRALQAYEHILSLDPHHLETKAGLKNAEALFFMKQDGWSSAATYRDVLR